MNRLLIRLLGLALIPGLLLDPSFAQAAVAPVPVGLSGSVPVAAFQAQALEPAKGDFREEPLMPGFAHRFFGALAGLSRSSREAGQGPLDRRRFGLRAAALLAAVVVPAAAVTPVYLTDTARLQEIPSYAKTRFPAITPFSSAEKGQIERALNVVRRYAESSSNPNAELRRIMSDPSVTLYFLRGSPAGFRSAITRSTRGASGEHRGRSLAYHHRQPDILLGWVYVVLDPATLASESALIETVLHETVGHVSVHDPRVTVTERASESRAFGAETAALEWAIDTKGGGLLPSAIVDDLREKELPRAQKAWESYGGPKARRTRFRFTDTEYVLGVFGVVLALILAFFHKPILALFRRGPRPPQNPGRPGRIGRRGFIIGLVSSPAVRKALKAAAGSAASATLSIILIHNALSSSGPMTMSLWGGGLISLLAGPLFLGFAFWKSRIRQTASMSSGDDPSAPGAGSIEIRSDESASPSATAAARGLAKGITKGPPDDLDLREELLKLLAEGTALEANRLVADAYAHRQRGFRTTQFLKRELECDLTRHPEEGDVVAIWGKLASPRLGWVNRRPRPYGKKSDWRVTSLMDGGEILADLRDKSVRRAVLFTRTTLATHRMGPDASLIMGAIRSLPFPHWETAFDPEMAAFKVMGENEEMVVRLSRNGTLLIAVRRLLAQQNTFEFYQDRHGLAEIRMPALGAQPLRLPPGSFHNLKQTKDGTVLELTGLAIAELVRLNFTDWRIETPTGVRLLIRPAKEKTDFTFPVGAGLLNFVSLGYWAWRFYSGGVSDEASPVEAALFQLDPVSLVLTLALVGALTASDRWGRVILENLRSLAGQGGRRLNLTSPGRLFLLAA